MGFRPSPYRTDIQGLRGIAVLAVLAYHYFPNLLPGGFSGVDVFFVISGFLITQNLLSSLHEDRFGFSDFYLARARRLLPALAFVLVTCAVVGWKVLLSNEHVNFGGYLAAGSVFLANFRSWRDASYFDVSADLKPLGHLWSLGIEEQFYLLWPLLLWLTWPSPKKLWRGLTAVTLISFAGNLWGAETYSTAMFFSPLSRLWELSLGAWVALGVRRLSSPTVRQQSWLSLTGVALLFVGLLTLRSTYYPTVAVLVPALGTALLIAAGSTGWVSQKLLSLRGLTFVGAISYPLYLWHWPILSFVRIGYAEVPSVVEKVGLLLLSLVLATVTHYCVELPVKTKRVSTGLTLSFCSLTLGCLLVLGTAVHRGAVQSPLQKASELFSRYNYTNGRSEKERFGPDSCFLANGIRARGKVSHCTEKKFPNAPTVMLVGDSSAGYLAPGLEHYLDKKRINFMHLSTSFCLPYEFVYHGPRCDKEARFTGEKVREIQPDVLVVFIAHQNGIKISSKVTYLRSLQNAANDFAESAKQVIVLGSAPFWRTDLPGVLFRHYVSKRREVPLRTNFDLVPHPHFINDTLKNVKFGARVRYVSLKSLLCNEAGCLTQVGPPARRSLIAWDQHHLTEVGASYVTQVAIAPLLESLKNRSVASR